MPKGHVRDSRNLDNPVLCWAARSKEQISLYDFAS